MPVESLFHQAALQLDWEDLPECISYRLYEHAKAIHCNQFTPTLEMILLWPGDILDRYKGVGTRIKPSLSYMRLARGYLRGLLDSINGGRKNLAVRLQVKDEGQRSWHNALWLIDYL